MDEFNSYSHSISRSGAGVGGRSDHILGVFGNSQVELKTKTSWTNELSVMMFTSSSPSLARKQFSEPR